MNPAEDRISNDFAPVTADEKVQCKTCKFKKAGVIGYKSGYCEKYPDGTGKPNAVLFENARCQYYAEEKPT